MSRTLVGTLALLCLSSSFGATVATLPPESVVLARQTPIDVSWGEIDILETPRVEAPYMGEPHTFAYAMGLEFVLRHRTESRPAGGAGESEVRSSSDTVASFWIALDFDAGDAAWHRYRDSVVALITRLSPAGYERFLNEIYGRLDLLGSQPYRFVCCVSRLDGNRAVSGSGTGSGPQFSAGMSTLDDPVPVCSALGKGFRYAPRIDRVTSALDVQVATEESVRVTWAARTEGGLVKLPSKASLKQRTPEPGMAGFSSSGTENGTSTYEELIPETPDSPSVIVSSSASDCEFPLDAFRARSVLGRWSIQTRRLAFGAEPAESAAQETVVYQGVFFHATPARDLDLAEYRRAVGRELATKAGHAEIDLSDALRAAVPKRLLPSAILVTCREKATGVFEAQYCLAEACAKITNAMPFCDELRREAGAPVR